MKRLICVLLCCAAALSPLAGCQMPSSGKAKPLKYDIPSSVLNLDPQFASDPYAKMIISNIYEGLMTYGSDGGLGLGVAEKYELSPDGRTLTFKLRGDARWKNGEQVTADDFVFAFRRLFRPDSPSPFAWEYIAIENARDILENKRGAYALGVEAKSADELVIRLEHKSPHFPGLLAETPAMPCNERFFNESRGRYGNDIKFVDSNGALYVERWDNEASIYLRPNTEYSSPEAPLTGGVNLRVGAEDSPFARLQSGAADIAVISSEDAEKLKSPDYSATGFNSTVWCIVFNQSSKLWGNPLLRQGLSYAVEQKLLSANLPKKFTPTNLFIPPLATLAGDEYRKYVDATPMPHDPEQGRRLFELGLSAFPPGEIPDTRFYVPDSTGHLLAMGMVQQSWQKHLSLYLNVEPLSNEEIRQRFLTGDYDMLLMPIKMDSPRAETMLSIFATGSPENSFGYHNGLYDSQIKAIAGAPSLEAAAEACARAETMLLQDAVIIPVYTETEIFAAAPGITGINATPFCQTLNFKYTVKE